MSFPTVTGIGAAFAALGLILAVRTHLWIRRAQIAPGTVIAMVATRGSSSGSNRNASYTPRVSFTASDGSLHEFQRSYSSYPPDFVVGEKIMVAYDPRSYEGRILTFGQRFGFAAVLLLVGCTLISISTVFLVGRQWVPRIYVEQAGNGLVRVR